MKPWIGPFRMLLCFGVIAHAASMAHYWYSPWSVYDAATGSALLFYLIFVEGKR